MPLTQGPTQFPELNDVLGRLVEGASGALGDNFVGAYLVGSFALGDSDIHSDCDFIVATGGPIPPAQEEAIRSLHEGFPSEDGHWNRHLEGSYAPIDDLRQLDALVVTGSSSTTAMPRWNGRPTATPWSIGGPFVITGWCPPDRRRTTSLRFPQASYASR